LADCNEALRLSPGNPSALDSRGFVYLKLGRFTDAIRDYDTALAKQPNQVNSLYGRGRAKQMAGMDPAGAERDIATALRLRPSVAQDFAQRGIPQN
jgi:tetratricopeptide (TPR) repeat protein